MEEFSCEPYSNVLKTTWFSPWCGMEIGGVDYNGDASYDSHASRFTVKGSGCDIWNSSGEFQLVSQKGCRNCTVVARVTDVGNSHSWAKAG